jgi:hypothetical protein
MTYNELASMIKNHMTVEQRNQDVTIFVPEGFRADEYYPAAVAYTAVDCDVLDEGHPIITIR